MRALVRRWMGIGLLALAGCGGGGGSGGTTPPPAAGAAPTITAAPQAASLTEGQTATFSVTASGDAPLAYQWLRNGSEIAGATASSHVTAPLTLADNGAAFAVRVSNGTGSVTSPGATLTVTAAPAPQLPARVRVSAGFYHTLATTADGSVLGWGMASALAAPGTSVAGTSARRFNGLSAQRAVDAGASIVTTSLSLGNDGRVWGWDYAATTPTVIGALGTATRVAHCDGSTGNAFALQASGTVRVRSGATLAGLTDVADISEDTFTGSGTCTLVAVKRDGTLWRAAVLSSGGTVLSADVQQVAGISGVVQASCSNGGNSGELCLAVTTAGAVYAWGSSNQYGQFGNGSTGSGPRVAPALVPGLSGIVRVFAGDAQALALAADGTLYRWGFQPFDAPIHTPAAMPGLAGRVVDMSASFNFVVVALEDGSVWGWGDNSQGQLGASTPAASTLVPVQATGINLN